MPIALCNSRGESQQPPAEQPTFGVSPRVRSWRLNSLFALLAALFVATNANANANADDRPNIVLFVTDDQSPDAGCYGNPVLQTPHLDALAAGGIRFTNAYAVTASCSSSRAAILTGRYPHAIGQYGLQHNQHNFEGFDAVVGLPALLSQAGYRTGLVGKLHVGPAASFPFDERLPANPRSTVAMAEASAEFVAADGPFFLLFATTDPHRSSLREGNLAPDAFGNEQPYPGVTPVEYDPAEVIVPPYLPDTPQCRAELAEYYRSISRVDQGLGRLIELLREAGAYDNTLFIYTSDHGIAMPSAKTNLYEAGLRVPLIVRTPGRPAGVSDALVSLVDLTPTLVEAAGENSQTPSDGRSLMPLLRDETQAVRDRVIGSHSLHEVTGYYPMRSVRGPRYKLIWNLAHDLPYPMAGDLWESSTWQAQLRKGMDAEFGLSTVGKLLHRPEFELYDLQNDPNETQNLADDPAHAATLAELKSELRQMQQQTNDPWLIKWKRE
ncbi:MAG: sulfatase [Planctomycetota bacterium]